MKRYGIGVGVAIAVGALVASAGPVAAAGGISGCALVTRKEASKILGGKVVKTKNVVDEDTGAQECTYTTKSFDSDFLEQAGSPIQLVLEWGPIAESLRGQYEGSDEIEGLGDAAYDLGFGSVVALSGEQSVQATIENSESPVPKLAKKAQKAIKLALPRLPTD